MSAPAKAYIGPTDGFTPHGMPYSIRRASGKWAKYPELYRLGYHISFHPLIIVFSQPRLYRSF